MVLRAMAALSLAVLSGAAHLGAVGELGAQEAQSTVHVVSAGETLSDIASRYLGSTSAWRALWEANRETISDPDAIEPGLRLVIPAAGEVAETVPASEVVIRTSEGGVPQGVRPSARPSGPVGAPRPDDRTVFFKDPADGPLQGGVIGSQTEEWLAVPEQIFHAASWLEAAEEDVEVPDHLGTIGSFASGEDGRGHRETAHGYETLSLIASGQHDLEVGDELVTFRVQRRTEELGFVVEPTGMVTVHRLEPARIVVVVTREFDRLLLGDYVTRAARYTLAKGVFPNDVADSMTAKVLAFQNHEQRIQGPGDLAYLDRGAQDGLAVGDEFVASVGGHETWSGSVLGRLQVVRVDENTASARILETTAPVWAEGMSVRLARKMP